MVGFEGFFSQSSDSHFRVMFTFVRKACGLRIYPYKISLLQDFGFAFLSGFVDGIHMTYPVRAVPVFCMLLRWLL